MQSLLNPTTKRRLRFDDDRSVRRKLPTTEGCLIQLEDEASNIQAFLAGEKDFTPAYLRLASASRYIASVTDTMRAAAVSSRLRTAELEGKVEVLERRNDILQKRIELAEAELRMWRRK
jgi:hypothetical protein